MIAPYAGIAIGLFVALWGVPRLRWIHVPLAAIWLAGLALGAGLAVFLEFPFMPVPAIAAALAWTAAFITAVRARTATPPPSGS